MNSTIKALVIGMVLASANALTGCFIQGPNGQYVPLLDPQFVQQPQQQYYPQPTSGGGQYYQSGMVGSVAVGGANPNVVTNAGSITMGSDTSTGIYDGNLRVVIDHEYDPWGTSYQVCFGSTCAQPFAGTMPVGTPVIGGLWTPMLPGAVGQRGALLRRDFSGVLERNDALTVTIRCFRGAAGMPPGQVAQSSQVVRVGFGQRARLVLNEVVCPGAQ